MNHWPLFFALAAPLAAAPAVPPARHTIVLVHGAWGGAYAWKEVARLLTEAGNTVYRPELTGQGERVHLATPAVGVSVHIQDVVNAIVWEDLHDVVLVGHSYGGMVITGVADRIPGRIRRLIYLDAFLPENGETGNDEFRLRRGDPPQKAGGYYPATWLKPGTPYPSDVAMPERTFEEPIALTNQAAARRIPSAYVMFLPPGRPPEQGDFYVFYRRAQSRGWPVTTLESGHNAHLEHPREEAQLIERLAQR
ncbi:MAG TPA: alpha/beta fold hydrolase [Opitutaceae bacterium]|nr:alpha/beta fold hydrolase [Opitutaceae bacterium]